MGGQSLEPLHTTQRLRRFKGLVVRNLVRAADDVGAPHAPPAGSAAGGADSDGGCFFSMHPVECASGKPSDTCVYVSTLCKERCNPSWSDVEHEDMRLTWTRDWEHQRMGIRIWTATRRPLGTQGERELRCNGSPSGGPSPRPRVALWERGTMIWQRAEAGAAAHDAPSAESGDQDADAEIPEWARRGDPFAAGSEVGKARRGGLLGGGWVDTYRGGAPGALAQPHYHVELALELLVVWGDWVLMETPLPQLAAPMPANAVFMTLADASSALHTYVDEANPSMAKLLLLKPHSAAADAPAGADSDSESAHGDVLSADAVNGADGGSANAVTGAAAEAALKDKEREKEREERERRKEAEREREKQQRSLLLGSKDSRTPSARNSGSGLWGAGVGMLKDKDSPLGDARRDGDGVKGVGDSARAGAGGAGSAGGAGGGEEVELGIPHKCRLRAKVLDERRARLEVRQREAREVKARLEALLATHAKREQEQHRHKQAKVRLNQLRRRVQEGEAALEELRTSVAAQERRLEQASGKDTEKAAQTLQTRALTVLDTQAQRAKTASQEAARAMGIDFALPPPAADDDDAGASSSMEDAMARHAQAMSIERKVLRELRRELKTRQHYLCACLHSTYPIYTAADGVTRTICGLALPAPSVVANSDEEMLSTALGHTCHMVQLLAKYSCVCLRYQPIAMASHSAMRDLTLPATKTNLKDGNDFPLFSKGQDRTRLQTAMQMLSKDVYQLLAVHGLVPVDPSLQVTPYGTQSTVLANLSNIVTTCRFRFLAAQGGLEALSALDSQAIKALAITMDDGLDLLGRSGGGSGGTSRASSEHGGASSEGKSRRREVHERALTASQQRASSGSEYVSGIAKRVDRLIESMMFPTVTTSTANGLGGGEGEGDADRAAGGSGKEKKKRREGREGKERRDGRRAREAAEAAEAAGCADREVSVSDSGGDGLSSREWAAPESPSLSANRANAWDSAGAGCVPMGAGNFESSLLALGGELPWGHDDVQEGAGDVRSNEERWNGGLDARTQTALTVDGGADFAGARAGARYDSSILDAGDASGGGGSGSQALYEMFKAATDQAASESSPSVGMGVLVVAPAYGGAGEENVDEEAWAAGIHRYVGGEEDVSPRPWVDLQ